MRARQAIRTRALHVAVGAFIVLLVGGAIAARAQQSPEEKPAETAGSKAEQKGLALGGKAPEFSLPDLDGKTVALSDRLKRGPVLIDFWALWCKPCLQSLPGTDALRAKYAARGLSVLAINTDSPRSAAKVKAYVKSGKFGFEVLTDPNGAMQRLYRFYRIPQTFLIAADGTIAFSQLGYSPGSEERLAKVIEKILPPGQGSKGE